MSYTMTTLNDSSQTLAYAEMDEVLDTPATPPLQRLMTWKRMNMVYLLNTEMKLWLFRKRLIKQCQTMGRSSC